MSKGRVIAGMFAGLTVIAVGVAVVFFLQYWAYVQRPVLAQGESVQLNIPHGANWATVVAALEEADLVGDPRYFRVWAQRRGLDRSVKAGHFELHGPMGLDELDDILRAGGKFDEVEITIIEGQNIFQIADALDTQGVVDRADFLRAARDQDAMDAAELSGESFEGYLFPDTYRLRKGSTAAELIQKFHARFLAVYDEESTKAAASLSTLEELHQMDRHGFVTMASLVEKETGAPEERPIISQVFYNRLAKKMKLQTDPTCVYSERTYKRRPRPSLCKDKLNRYSTYVIDGLPPGPIANPGRASIRAAMAPDGSPEARKYLFFVARRDGTRRHKFSATYVEHKRAVNRYLKKKGKK